MFSQYPKFNCSFIKNSSLFVSVLVPFVSNNNKNKNAFVKLQISIKCSYALFTILHNITLI